MALLLPTRFSGGVLLGLHRSQRSAAASVGLYLMSQRTLKEIRVVEGPGKVTVVEGVQVESDRKARLINPDMIPTAATGCPSNQCHPLCRMPFVHQIKHTDILILNQFVREDGKIMERKVTGLCRRQHKRVDKLIKMAQKAGLFPQHKDIFTEEKEKFLWAKYNSYWDEKTIDIQWNENERGDKRKEFTK